MAARSDPVSFFFRTMPGAPLSSGINNTAGELITLLDGCLVNGFGQVTLNSLTVSSSVATATVNAGHGFFNLGTRGPCVLIDGATPSGLNGKKIITVSSSTVFTFDATGISDGSASGTITAKIAPLGWSKVYSGTNKAVYRSNSAYSPRPYLRVDDTVGAYARTRGYMSMSDVDTGTEMFPNDVQNSGGMYSHKSNGTTRRVWELIGDDRAFYLVMDAAGGSNTAGHLVFGDFVPSLSSDAYACMMGAGSTSSATTAGFGYFASTSYYSYAPRAINQSAGSTAQIRYQAGHSSSLLNSVGESTTPACGYRRFYQAEIWDGTTTFRGWIPGFWTSTSTFTWGDVVEGNDGALLNRRLYTSQIAGYTFQLDVDGPWFSD